MGGLQSIPFGSGTSGAEVHANVADNWLNRCYIQDTGLLHGVSLLALLLLASVITWPLLAYAVFAAGRRHLGKLGRAAGDDRLSGHSRLHLHF
ncbi:MAG TPA: hypothetical protein VF173_25480 [Thermoanaerobaculia bacterium]|nr:hypothetical protein [Thermoanaerobaculia bacterium]